MTSYYLINDANSYSYISNVIDKEITNETCTVFTNSMIIIDNYYDSYQLHFRGDSGMTSDIQLLDQIIDEFNDEQNGHFIIRANYINYNFINKSLFVQNKLSFTRKIIIYELNDNHRDTQEFMTKLNFLLNKSRNKKNNLNIYILSNAKFPIDFYNKINNFIFHVKQNDNDLLYLLKTLNLNNKFILNAKYMIEDYQIVTRKNGILEFLNNFIETIEEEKDISYYINQIIIL